MALGQQENEMKGYTEIKYSENLKISYNETLPSYLIEFLHQMTKTPLVQSDFKNRTNFSWSSWKSTKRTGIFKGNPHLGEGPEWGWKGREIIHLSEKYPFLKFRISFKWFDFADIQVCGNKERFFFNREKDFYDKLESRKRDFSIFKEPLFLRCLPVQELESLALRVSQFSVTMDEVLEEVST
jgi:hypothetical protein